MALKSLKNITENNSDACIEMFGNKRILITDCKYVSDYSDGSISLNIGDMDVKIKGDGLVISAFAFGQTDISGNIFSVEFVNSQKV